jgi:uncharacterized membrane protein
MADEGLFPTTRLEAFSDGVLAVVITIMVLELKVPHTDGFAGLFSIMPTLFIYLISFSFTAIYWVNHHHLIRRVEHCDHRVLYANLAYLFAASLLPFFTSYVIEKGSDSFSVALYAGSMIFTGFCFLLLRLTIERLLRRAGNLSHEDTATERRHIVCLMLYVIAIPLAHFHPYLALGVIMLVTLIWILPTAGVEPCPDGKPSP